MAKEIKCSKEGLARIDILDAGLSAEKNGAHLAPSLSVVDICLAILNEFNKSDDVFVLSKGHGALGYYAAMHQMGMITDKQFASFEQNGGDFPGQPSRSASNGISYSSGSLGMGLSYGLGVALAKRASLGKVYVVLGDGELNEGSNWEAASLASRYNLDNLIAIVDNNSLQSDGKCDEIVGQKLESLWEAHGWIVKTCDGHSIDVILKTMKSEHAGKPLVVLAKTIKGKGVSFMENNNSWHHAILSVEDYHKAIEEIEIKYGLQ